MGSFNYSFFSSFTFPGNATEIVTDVEIRSFGPVSENDMVSIILSK